ncbi:MAG: prepilin-type N-terminal cleavage/methylation domain-containing protein [Phycisphaeraceae bacterium]
MHTHRPNPPHRHAAGFSLIELVIAIALSAVVMMALGSAIVLASRAMPGADSPALTSHETGRVLEQFSNDLQHAIHITERSDHAVTFTVADRDGDGSPQRIRYAWAGSPGDPLTWQLDEHDPVDLLPAIDAFDLTYEQVARTETYPGPAVEGIQTAVSSHGTPAFSDRDEFSITSSNWIGQFITPDLTADTIAWRPTYASYRAARPLLFAADHQVRLVAPELNGTPSANVLAHKTQDIGLLDLSISWRQANFGKTPMLMPGQPVNLIVRHPGWGGTAAYVQFDTNAPAGGMTRTTNGQSGWEAIQTGLALSHALYAIPYTAGPDQSLTREHLQRVTFNLQVTGADIAPVSGAVHLPNRPSLLAAHWELDFRHDPTALDTNADGEPDWQVVTGQAFATADLKADGVWQARQALRTWPDHDFTEPTMVHLRMRHTTANAGGALAMLYADRSSSLAGPVGAFVQRQSDGTQTVTLLTLDADHDPVALATLPGYHGGMLDVRLLVSPAQRSVHLMVEGVDRGSYRYNRVSNSGLNRALNIMGFYTDAVEFQHVRVTVGGTP